MAWNEDKSRVRILFAVGVFSEAEEQKLSLAGGAKLWYWLGFCIGTQRD